MKIEPIITDMGIIKKSKNSIYLDLADQEWNTLTLYGSINSDYLNTKNNQSIKFILYFNDMIFYTCYDFDFYPNLHVLKSSFDIIKSSKLIKKITGHNETIYIHFVLITCDYVYEIISSGYILELNSKEENLEKYYDENNWKNFCKQFKNYH